MLDVLDFVEERGGNPKQIRESQRRRHAPEALVDEVLDMYEDNRKSEPVVSKVINQRLFVYLTLPCCVCSNFDRPLL